ncbi:MAG: acetylornithine aminotransferase [Sandaracinus sp.]|nr:acetylornithine aminotransferase [Sandaracinus sp.]
MTTIGESIRQSPAVKQAIDAIVAEVEAKTAAIEGPKPPDPGLKTEYDALVKAAGASRGRDLLYPYLGSGAGRGALVELADGSIKWDLVTGIGVHVMGHSHPAVIRAQLESSLEDTTKHGNLQSGTAPYAFAQKLVDLASRNSNLRHAFLTTSGAMANESALKVCMQKTAPADRVLAFEHCFMGRSLTMTSIGDNAAARDGLPINQPVDYVPFWDGIEADEMGGATRWIDRAIAKVQGYIDRFPKRHAMFVMELVQGEGGFNVPHKTYLEELMKLCKANGIPVWDDEIQAFGRTTEMFAYETFGLGEYVDVFCVGKMTHACAAMFTEDMNPRPGLLSGTFTGATVDFAVGSAVLDELANGGYYGEEGKFAQHHAAFRAEAEKLIAKHPEWFPEFRGEPVAGIGGMMRLTPFGGAKDKIVAAAKAIYDEGAIVFWCGHGPYHLRMLPPVPAIELSQWPTIFETLEKGLAKAAG